MTAPFRRTDEETVYEGYVIEVTVATYEDDAGNEFRRDTIHHPGAVAAIPVHDDGTVTLVRQFRPALLADLLEIPAGLRDVAGEPVEQTAARELVEEVGLEAGTLELLTAFHNAAGYADEVIHVFKATDLRSVPNDLQGPEEAAMTVERYPISDLVAMVERGEITDAKTIISILMVARG